MGSSSTLIYTSELIFCSTICVPSATRRNIHLYPCCGKSHFVKRLLESGEDMIEGAPENIIWCYGIYQPAYDEMLRSTPNISLVEGVPGDLESMINPFKRIFVVIDVLMNELSNDQRITSLFTKGCHHRTLSVIFVLQNIFHRGNELKLPLLGTVQVSQR